MDHAVSTAGPITVVVVGAGHRSIIYADYALQHPERMKVVAVVDPNADNRTVFAQMHDIPAAGQFAGLEEYLASGIQAHAAINGTMDKIHYATAKPLIERGMHMLLEKPIAPSEFEVRDLIDAASRHNVLVMICHVIRYAPFYATIKKLIDAGHIGQIMSIRTTEAVSYHHMSTAYVRGKWNRTETSNPMLMAKCCHDLDLISWLMSGVKPASVASVGELSWFRPENAPVGSTDRCLNGCTVEPTCPYSAKKMYTQVSFGFGYAFEMYKRELTLEEKLHSLATDNPYGRCVWRCDNNVVDHQTVIVRFENGVTATHDMVTNSARPTRNIHIIGTAGEIEGDMERGHFYERHFDLHAPKGYTETFTDVNITGGAGQNGHGGGDIGLITDFISILRGEKSAKGSTRIQDSLAGHLIAFAADESMRTGKTVHLQ